MIQKLQRKIQFTIFLIFLSILLGILAFINIFSYSSAVSNANQLLEEILDNYIPSPNYPITLSSEDLFSGARFYLVKYVSGESDIHYSNEPLTEDLWETIRSYTEEILQSRRTKGTIGSFRYMVRSQNDGSVFIAFLNVSFWNIQGKNFLFHSLLCFIAALPVFGLISLALSKWLVSPVAEGFERQRQFISDAGHELKTPLAVINANADILESEIGPNKWLTYIQTEIRRTSSLINHLLLFTKIDAQEENSPLECFDLAQAVLAVVLPFESVAYEKQVLIEWDIPSALSLRGDEEQLKQLTAILVDNAVSHAYSNTVISISLKAEHHKVFLTVSNQGDTIPMEEQQRIFERFYRIDKARNRSSGHYGLGLAIAKSIVTRHKGKLLVWSADNNTAFTAELPQERV